MQLLQWHKRRSAAPEACRLYRLAPHCSAAPTYLVPKAVCPVRAAALDPRGAFVVQLPAALYVWQVRRAEVHVLHVIVVHGALCGCCLLESCPLDAQEINATVLRCQRCHAKPHILLL